MGFPADQQRTAGQGKLFRHRFRKQAAVVDHPVPPAVFRHGNPGDHGSFREAEVPGQGLQQGCQFLCWHGDDGSDYNANANYDIADDLTLNAVWNKQFALTYLPSGDYQVGAEKFTVRSDQITSSSVHNFITRHPTNHNYEFAGWSLTDGETEAISSIPLSAFTLNASGTGFEATVYAVWTPKSAAVTYDANLSEGFTASGMPADESFTADELGNDLKWYFPDETPTANGYTFLGWDMIIYNSDGESQHEAFYDRNSTPIAYLVWDFDRFASAVIKARWQKNFTVFYDYNVEEGVTISDNIFENIPDKREFTDCAADSAEDRLIADGKYTIGSDGILMAEYYRTDDSEGHSYIWKGWAKTADAALSDCVTQLDETDFIYNAATDRFEATIYGTWQRKAEITWHFIHDSLGSENQDATEITKGNPGFTDYPVLRPSLTHHILDGWTTNEDGTGTFYGVNDTVTTDENMDLYAVLTRRFKLTYVATSPYMGNSAVMPGGSGTSNAESEEFTVPVSEIENDTVHPMFDDEPTLTGAQDRYFIGWSYTNNTGTGEGLLDEDAIPLSLFEKGAATDGVGYYIAQVYSLWSEKPYSVIYINTLPEGSVVTAFPENATALTYSQVRHGYRISSVRPTAPGYNFTQYYTYSKTLGESASVHGHATPNGSLRYLDFFGPDQQVRIQANWTQNRQFVLDANADDDTVESLNYTGATLTVHDFSSPSTFSTIAASGKRTAHTLDYWALDAAGENPLPDPENNYEISADHFVLNQENNRFECTVYAMWKRHYAVRYNGNGDGDTVSGVPTAEYSFYESTRTAEKALGNNAPTRSGYQFKGWALTPDATEALADNKIPLNLTAFTLNREREYYEATVYALWEPNEHTVSYVLEYDDDVEAADVGVSAPTSQTHSYREENIAVAAAPSGYDTAAYTFGGWKTADATVTGGTFTMPDKDVTFKGKFTRNVRTVTYKPGEGSGDDVAETFTPGSKTSVREGSIFTPPTGKEFDRWECDTEGYSATIGDEITVNDNVTYTAVWKNVYYTVTYQSGGEPVEEYSDTGISGNYTLLGIGDTGFTVPEGKTFDGWKLVTPDDKGYPENAEAGESVNVISDVTYEAQWQTNPPVITTATIHYTSGLTEDYPGYNESCADAFVINEVPTSEEYAVLGNDPQNENNPSFAPDGYTFAGWKLVSGTGGSSPTPRAASGSAGEDGLYHEGDTVATADLTSGSVTLKAMWNCKLRYDANEGTGALPEDGKDITQFVGDSVTVANGSGLKQGSMSFAYWSTSANNEIGRTHYSPSANFVIKEDTVLYAIYTDSPGDDPGSGEPDGSTFTLTYKANGGTGNVPDEKTYSAGATVPVASKGDLVRTGCTFKEWNTKPNGSGAGYKGDGSDSFVIRSDTTLYAIWLDGSGKIVPSPGTGESSLPIIIAFNAALLSLAALAFIVSNERRKTAKFQ